MHKGSLPRERSILALNQAWSVAKCSTVAPRGSRQPQALSIFDDRLPARPVTHAAQRQMLAPVFGGALRTDNWPLFTATKVLFPSEFHVSGHHSTDASNPYQALCPRRNEWRYPSDRSEEMPNIGNTSEEEVATRPQYCNRDVYTRHCRDAAPKAGGPSLMRVNRTGGKTPGQAGPFSRNASVSQVDKTVAAIEPVVEYRADR